MTSLAPVTKCEVEAASRLVNGIVLHTPLVPFGAANDRILLKPEIHQPAGCFKIRGVLNAVSRLDPKTRARGLSTVSAGNMAKALAWVGRHFGVPARSLMPEGAPETKKRAMRAYGGTPILVSVDALFGFLKEQRWEDEPYAFIHPWIDRDVQIGHGTMGLEILADCPDVASVYLPVGGGGLLCGVAGALKVLKPSIRIIAVEPEQCCAFHASRVEGRPVSVACDTMCDGVAVPYMTEQAFQLLDHLVDDTVLVTEPEVHAAIRRLAVEGHLISEGAGALALAAAAKVSPAERGLTVCPVTGGSIDKEKLVAILSEG